MSPSPSEAARSVGGPSVRFFATALVLLLAGYMFMGRGFAHLGVPPIYIGEVVLAIGVLTTAGAIARFRPRLVPSRVVGLLVLFMVLGLARTVPYIGTYGTDAIRDAVLWGYGLVALMICVLADRTWLEGARRSYAIVVPIFAVWLPVAWIVFNSYQDLIPLASGDISVLFFKNQDMAVHAVGALAFVVTMWRDWVNPVEFGRRFAVAVPLAWGVFVTGSISRGALAAAALGLGVLATLARRSKNWVPVLAAGVAVAVVVSLSGGLDTPANPTGEPSGGRTITLAQWSENIWSILFSAADANLEGTKVYRLTWWGTIVDYTVNGPHFWDGKGFGINLADDDGFQILADRSLRAPHNSHLTVLARMGVPGLVIWLLLQGAFGVSLVRSILASRRADPLLAGTGVWILVYWVAMMVNTTFDPYLEGPQGGIWFWTLFGLGLVVIRLAPRRAAA